MRDFKQLLLAGFLIFLVWLVASVMSTLAVYLLMEIVKGAL